MRSRIVVVSLYIHCRLFSPVPVLELPCILVRFVLPPCFPCHSFESLKDEFLFLHIFSRIPNAQRLVPTREESCKTVCDRKSAELIETKVDIGKGGNRRPST